MKLNEFPSEQAIRVNVVSLSCCLASGLTMWTVISIQQLHVSQTRRQTTGDIFPSTRTTRRGAKQKHFSLWISHRLYLYYREEIKKINLSSALHSFSVGTSMYTQEPRRHTQYMTWLPMVPLCVMKWPYYTASPSLDYYLGGRLCSQEPIKWQNCSWS